MTVIVFVLSIVLYIPGMFAARNLVTRNDPESHTGFLAFLLLMIFPPIPIAIWVYQRWVDTRPH